MAASLVPVTTTCGAEATTAGFSTTTVFSMTLGAGSTMTGAGRGSMTARTRFTMSVASWMPLVAGSWRSRAKVAGARMTAAVKAAPMASVLLIVFLVQSPMEEGLMVFRQETNRF